jgi:hypothetical protein
MRAAVKIFDEVFGEFEREPEMSSAADRQHGEHSWHYYGMAFDVTMKGIGSETRYRITTRLRKRIVKPFQLIKHSGSHWHVEYDIDAYPEYRRGSHI